METHLHHHHHHHHHSLLLVLGVFSQDTPSNALLRQASRRTWMTSPNVDDEVVVRFAIRGGGGVSSPLVVEAEANNDVVLSKSNKTLPRATGPINSLIDWFAYATTTYPDAAFVGKADDDAFVRLAPLRSHLSTVEALFPPRGSPVYFGRFEMFHWLRASESPIGFSWFGGRMRPCKVTTALTGPFPFAKGALFAVSAPVAAGVAASPFARASLANITAHTGPRKNNPWEDAWLGYVLAATVPRLSLAHMPLSLLAEGWGNRSAVRDARDKIYWHGGGKSEKKYVETARWFDELNSDVPSAGSGGEDASTSHLRLSSCAPFQSCAASASLLEAVSWNACRLVTKKDGIGVSR